PSGYYGQTIPDTVISRSPQESVLATSWMEILPDFSVLRGYETRPFDAMAVTVAHEFHHGCQFGGYDALEAEFRNQRLQSWWLEVSAVTMEDIVFNDVNDYRLYLPFFFSYPGWSLRLFEGSINEQLHPYGSVIWGKFLTERFGQTILRRIWEICGETPGFNTFDAFKQALSEQGTSFDREWAEFLVWNYFTGSRAASWGYREGAFYPEYVDSQLVPYDQYPVADTSSATGFPHNTDELAASYMAFRPPPSDTPTTFHILVTPHRPSDFEQWMLVTAGIRGTAEPVVHFTRDILSGPINFADWGIFDQVLVIASPFKEDPKEERLDRALSYSFEVRDTLSGLVTATAIKKVYSNPLDLSAGGDAAFQIDVARADPVPVALQIFTIDGQLVRGPDYGDTGDPMHKEKGRTLARLSWDGTNDARRTVASGIYLALVQIGDKREVIKVAIKNGR
ncbi:MAG: hypothetical protein HY304_00090, partial [candidate division Zixibacteria bacterium]|nr:hypothetical protein [candidate division Zixibacteria bacterium]